MIVKMKFLNISGPRADIDRMSATYLSKYEMQLENAITELKTTDNLLPFAEVNPYKDTLAKAKQYAELLPETIQEMDTSLSEEAMIAFIRDLNHDYLDLKESLEQVKKQRETYDQKLRKMEPFGPLEIDVAQVDGYHFLKTRFGRVGLDNYHRLEKYLFEDLNAVFLEGVRDENYVYGCYFTSHKEAGKVDSVFKSLHFEEIPLEIEAGIPAEIIRGLKNSIAELDKTIANIENDMQEALRSNGAKLLGTVKKLEEISNNFDVRKMAARTGVNEDSEDYYILCGWMSEDDVEAFVKESQNDDRVTVLVEEGREKFFGDPPTKLKNPKFFKPFEMFIKMYGLPAHDEMDPTIFVALTYTFIFGAMFGDVGQGICLFVGGGLLYLIKKVNLAGIISVAGIFSTFFGFMYGSFFGFENTIVKAHWLSPMHAMTNLPLIGQLNTVFVVAIGFGMALILLAMVFQIINAMRQGDKENMLFSANGIAGLVFYGCIVATVVLFMTGHKTPSNILLVIFLGVPILLFVLKEPLGKLVEGKSAKPEDGVGMFLVQGFFELFETMLSFFSNTISFVRIGAFAVSHGAMMQVVLMLGGITDGAGNPNWVVIILGNLLVSGLEGLVVGIQVLRLEYYEMFSRFYKGTGREFTPFTNQSKKHTK